MSEGGVITKLESEALRKVKYAHSYNITTNNIISDFWQLKQPCIFDRGASRVQSARALPRETDDWTVTQYCLSRE